MSQLILQFMTEKTFTDDYFDLKLYEKAVKRYGELEYNQSFCFVPLLGLGGKKSIDNLDKGDTLTHISIISLGTKSLYLSITSSGISFSFLKSLNISLPHYLLNLL